MATTGKKGKKQKGKTLVLSEFLAGDHGHSGQAVVMAPSKTSWADEMADEEQIYKEKLLLPTAPRAARGSDVDESMIPNMPPYTAHIANLPYDIDNEDVTKFFHGLRVKSVRLPREGGESGRMRGFGYAEFETRQDLVEALTMNELMIKNRKIRVDVAVQGDGEQEQQGGMMGMGRGRGRPPREEMEDRTPSDWRNAPREGLPPLQGRDGPSRGGYGDRMGGDRDREEQGERYAAGFNPRAGARMMQETSDRGSFGGPRRDGPSSYGRDRDGPSSFGRDRDGPSSFSRNRDGPSSYGRDRDGPSFSRDALRPSEGRPSAAEAPKERPKLSLKPRSVPLEEGASNDGAEEPNAPAPAPASSANIFGLAKPVDTAARERAIEERLKERERERAEPSRGREMSRPDRARDIRDGSHGSGSGRSADRHSGGGGGADADHGDADEDRRDKPMDRGGYRPPRDGDRDYRSSRDNDRDYRPPRDGDYRPQRDGDYRAPRDGDYRPPRDNDRDYRPPRDNDRDYRPPRDNDRDYRPPRDNDRDYRPPRDNDYRPRDGDYRPPRDTDRDYRPPARGGNDYRPPARGGNDYRPPRDTDRDYRPPRSGDDSRENGYGSKAGAHARSDGGRNREMDRPRSRGDGAGSPGDVPRVRKFEEPKAPVFENRNKFSFLVAEDAAEESDGRDDQD